MFVIIQVIHFTIKPYGDDLIFAAVQFDNQTLLQYLEVKYNTWSSRLILETLFVVFNKLPIIIWMVLDSLLFTLIAYLISILFNEDKHITYNWIIVLSVLIYPFYHLNSAGYITTTIAYVWPMCGMLFTLYLLKKLIEEQTIKKYDYLLLAISLPLALNMEQYLSVLLGFLILTFVYLYLSKKLNIHKHWLLLVIFVLTILSLMFTLSTPGNASRVISETAYWYPEYANFNVLTKLYLGIVHTMSGILNNSIIIFMFSTLLTCVIYIKTKRFIYRALSIIVLLFFTVFLFLQFLQELLPSMFNLIMSVFPYLQQFHTIIFQEQMINEITLHHLTPLLFIIFIIASIFTLLFTAFDKKWLPLVIFAAALCSRIIMGFSPTVFASSTRTAFITFFGIIILIYLLFKEIITADYRVLSKLLLSLLIILVIVSFIRLLAYQVIVFGYFA